MRLEKKVLSELPDGRLYSIANTTVIHNVPSNVRYEEVWVFAVNPNDHPIEVVLQITGIPDERYELPTSLIPYPLMAKALDPKDSVTVNTKEEVLLTGYVNRATKN